MPDSARDGCLCCAVSGTEMLAFPGTKVRMLLRSVRAGCSRSGTQFTRVTGTKVQMLLLLTVLEIFVSGVQFQVLGLLGLLVQKDKY
jgi:hypothetical protein